MRRHAPLPQIEPLEARISPAAVIVLGAGTSVNNPLTYSNTAANAKGITQLAFYNASPAINGATNIIQTTALKTQPDLLTANQYNILSSAVGQNPDVYFIKLGAGDEVEVPTSVGYQTLVNVTQGTVVAFFSSTGSIVGADQLTGVSVGAKTAVSIGTDVHGDIVTNYNSFTGAIGGSGEAPGTTTQLIPYPPVKDNPVTNAVSSITVTGSVLGNIVSGVNVNRIFVTENVNGILTGTAANNYSYQFVDPTLAANAPNAYSHTLSVPAESGVAGPSLSNLTIGSVGFITLGAGGAGAKGGSLSGLTLLDDITPVTILGGAGGNGGVGSKTSGGAGGSISGVVFQPPPSTIDSTTGLAISTDNNPNALISIIGGAGGSGLGTAKGGAGGSVTGIYTDYNSANSANPGLANLLSNVQVLGGTGGNGGVAGAGGSIANVFLLTSTPHESTLANQIEFQLMGGAGGSATVGGKAGAGGKVTNAQVIDNALPAIDYSLVAPLPDDSLATSPTNNVTLIQGGAGGTDSVKGSGGAGGLVSGITLKGYNFALIGGAGGDGATSGGAGGAVSGVTVVGSSGDLPGDNYHVQELYLAGGAGGSGGTGKGGAGGSVSGLIAQNADFDANGAVLSSAIVTVSADSLIANDTTGLVFVGGNGGNAGKGVAGAGGSISTAKLTEIDFLTVEHPSGNTGGISAIAGKGGDSTSAGGTGGAGGSVNGITNAGLRLAAANITGGAGGAGGGGGNTGKGGAGGSVTGLSLTSSEDIYPTSPTYTSASGGLLLDTSADFVGDGVVPGDVVENTLTGQVTSVVAVSGTVPNPVTTTELTLASDIFAVGDPYLLINENVAGTAGDSQDTIIDNTVNFTNEGVQVGDVVENITSAGLGSTPDTATVLQVVNAHELAVSADISRVGNQYGFTVLGGVTGTSTVLLAANSNFITDGVALGDPIEDLTATAANGGIPVTATITGFTAHTLTLSAPIANVADQYDFPTLSGDVYSFTGGNGGAGAVKGAGGVGGSIVTSNANTPTNIIMTGGVGGAGGAVGAAGAGGSLNNVTAISVLGSGSLIAGNAGSSGGKAGAGGGVNGGDIEALLNVTMTGGTGTNGGVGGSITHGGYSGILTSGGGFNPPSGNITIQAGAGGTSATGNGGAGGSIAGLTGFISSGDGGDQFITQLDAGAGGNGVKVAGAGGSVNGVRFYGGGGQGVDFFINAGDAGNASAGKTGATGGSVLNIGGGALGSGSQNSNFSVSTFTDFNHISAGNGGNAVNKGGTGGSVENVFVNATIGIRTGAVFGFDVANVNGASVTGAGGISVGSGGSGAIAGTPGNVVNISADAIASIVAGHMHVGQAIESSNLANIVTNVELTGLTPPSTVQNFVLTVYNSNDGVTETTVSLPTNASTIQVASALNALPEIQNAGGVTVSKGTNGYVVTFVDKGPQSPTITLSGAEPASENDGGRAGTVETVQGSVDNDIQEVQNVGVATVTTLPFTLSFDGSTTPQLPARATPAEVAAALNALPTVNAVGGVTVAASNTGYVVTFVTPGQEDLISSNITPYTTELATGSATSAEVQNVQMFANQAFTLTYAGQTTAQLAANASPAAVEAALDMLSNIPAGGVSVTTGTGTVNPSYQITFNSDGQQPLIVPNFSLGVVNTPGSASTQEVDTFTLPTRGDIDPIEFATANFVGSIYNILQPNATTYTPNGSAFTFGDVPVDGLIAALSPLVKSGSTIIQPFEHKNFVPEAYLTESSTGAAVMVDNTTS